MMEGAVGRTVCESVDEMEEHTWVPWDPWEPIYGMVQWHWNNSVALE